MLSLSVANSRAGSSLISLIISIDLCEDVSKDLIESISLSGQFDMDF